MDHWARRLNGSIMLMNDLGRPRSLEITPEMIAAGEEAIQEEVGGAEDLGTWFSASKLARKVFVAMWSCRCDG